MKTSNRFATSTDILVAKFQALLYSMYICTSFSGSKSLSLESLLSLSGSLCNVKKKTKINGSTGGWFDESSCIHTVPCP